MVVCFLDSFVEVSFKLLVGFSDVETVAVGAQKPLRNQVSAFVGTFAAVFGAGGAAFLRRAATVAAGDADPTVRRAGGAALARSADAVAAHVRAVAAIVRTASTGLLRVASVVTTDQGALTTVERA